MRGTKAQARHTHCNPRHSTQQQQQQRQRSQSIIIPTHTPQHDTTTDTTTQATQRQTGCITPQTTHSFTSSSSSSIIIIIIIINNNSSASTLKTNKYVPSSRQLRSCRRSFVPSFVRAVVRSFVRAVVRSFVRSFVEVRRSSTDGDRRRPTVRRTVKADSWLWPQCLSEVSEL